MTKKEKTRKSKRKIQYYDYSLVAILVFLICFGLVMLYSTSSYSALIDYQDSMFYFKRQLIFWLDWECCMLYLRLIITGILSVRNFSISFPSF